MKKYYRICRGCGIEFFADNWATHYCTAECRIEKQKRDHLEYMRLHDKKKNGKKKKPTPLDERARRLKETGMKACVLEAYKDNPQQLQRVIFYYYQNGLAKPCNENEHRKIGYSGRR